MGRHRRYHVWLVGRLWDYRTRYLPATCRRYRRFFVALYGVADDPERTDTDRHGQTGQHVLLDSGTDDYESRHHPGVHWVVQRHQWREQFGTKRRSCACRRRWRRVSTVVADPLTADHLVGTRFHAARDVVD